MTQLLWKNSLAGHHNIKRTLSIYDSAVLLLAIYSRDTKTDVHTKPV